MGRTARGATTAGIVVVFAVTLTVAVLLDGPGPLARVLLLRAMALLVVLFAAAEVVAAVAGSPR